MNTALASAIGFAASVEPMPNYVLVASWDNGVKLYRAMTVEGASMMDSWRTRIHYGPYGTYEETLEAGEDSQFVVVVPPDLLEEGGDEEAVALGFAIRKMVGTPSGWQLHNVYYTDTRLERIDRWYPAEFDPEFSPADIPAKLRWWLTDEIGLKPFSIRYPVHPALASSIELSSDYLHEPQALMGFPHIAPDDQFHPNLEHINELVVASADLEGAYAAHGSARGRIDEPALENRVFHAARNIVDGIGLHFNVENRLRG